MWMYVNETQEENKQNVHIRSLDDRVVCYYLFLREPLMKGETGAYGLLRFLAVPVRHCL